MTHALLTALLLLALPGQADEPQAWPVSGESLAARLTAVDKDWQLTFRTAGENRSMAASELVRWGAPVEATARPLVVLADGGLLVADLLEADRHKVLIESLATGRLELARATVAGIILSPPAESLQCDRLLDRIVQSEGRADRLLLVNGDEITGTLQAIGEEKVTLAAEVGPLEIEMVRVAAFIFNPALVDRPPDEGLRAWVGLADGSRLIARQLALTASGARITILGRQNCAALPEDLVFLQPLGGGVEYLSDLEDAGYKHIPYLDQPWPYHRDRNVLGGRLRARGQLHLKGLGMHAASRLTYTLAGEYRRFDGLLVLDDIAGQGGSVRYRVFVDGAEKYASEILRGGDEPVPVSVDVAGAKRLDLVIDFADRGPVLDRADWLEARLVK